MIYESVDFGKNISIGKNSIIEENVTIGDNVVIGNNVTIKAFTKIGNGVQINDLTVLGKNPSTNKKMARKPSINGDPLVIEDDVIIGCNCVIYRSVLLQKGVFVGDLSSIRENVLVGKDSIIGRNVMVENKTTIGKRVTIQTGCYITADMIIEDNVFIGPCCSTSNDKYMGMGNFEHQGPIIKQGAKIGNNATLLPAVVIGENSIIGAGAVITKDVPSNKTVVGNPGHVIK
jgi:acetyltransferase-like isoleucine patch superfamily enzyme